MLMLLAARGIKVAFALPLAAVAYLFLMSHAQGQVYWFMLFAFPVYLLAVGALQLSDFVKHAGGQGAKQTRDD